jgi:leader peptidase (prepilin peptidase)/N-methyltransferase
MNQYFFSQEILSTGTSLHPLIIASSIIFGLIIGSFQNALIYRLPRKISLTNPKRSICTSCNQEIRAIDNIPVLSWINLNGECRNCKDKISVLYPVVELLNGLFCLIAISHWGLNPTGILMYFFFSILLTLSIIDLQHMILPDAINKPGVVFGISIGILNQYYKIFDIPFSQSLQESLIGCALGYGILYAVAWSYFQISKVDGLGGGDLKFMAFTGALYGPLPIIPTLITGSLLGVCFALFGLLFKRIKIRTELPFGPWLALALVLYLFGFDSTHYTNELIHKIIVGSSTP